MSFASRLKESRLKAGQSLQGLADAIGVSKAHLWELEMGKSKNPSAEMLSKLSDHFKTSVSWWFGEEVGDDDNLRVMYRNLQELDPDDLELIQALIEKRKSQREKEKDKERGDDPDRQDGPG